MGRKCCVWHCKSGYDSESDSEKKKPDYEPVPIYAFPVNEEEKKNVWCDRLPKSTVNKETNVTWQKTLKTLRGGCAHGQDLQPRKTSPTTRLLAQ